MSLLVYGSYGYTGRLVVEECDRREVEPVVAGRNGAKVEAQADDHGLNPRVFSLDDVSEVEAGLDGIDAVLNCAGPFADTYEPLVGACLSEGVDYLDITGELGVFEALADLDTDAAEAGVTLLPGVGFDVVPSDCLAAHLVDRLPEANYIALALRGAGSISSGTARTAVDAAGEDGYVRRERILEEVPLGWKTRHVDFGDGRGTVEASSMPLGDLSTAYRSTGVENIEGYVHLPSGGDLALRAARLAGPVLRTRPAKAVLERAADALAEGPDEREREEAHAYVWGEARGGGKRVVSRLRTPETYALTARTATEALRRVGDVDAGFQTPATAYGKDFVVGFEGVEREDVD